MRTASLLMGKLFHQEHFPGGPTISDPETTEPDLTCSQTEGQQNPEDNTYNQLRGHPEPSSSAFVHLGLNAQFRSGFTDPGPAAVLVPSSAAAAAAAARRQSFV